MTDAEANRILDGCLHGCWIGPGENDDTMWDGDLVSLDGSFTSEQLRALLHFAQKEPRWTL